MPLNPDVFLSPGYVEAMVRMLKSDPDVGWVSGKLLFADVEGVPTGQIYSVGHAVFPDGYAINIGFKQTDGLEYSNVREVFGANGAAPLYRRQMLEDVQASPGEVFDETISLYGECA